MTKKFRQIQCSILLSSASSLFVAFYLQYIEGLAPCPLCMMQRFCIFLLLVLSLIGLFRVAISIAISQFLFAVFGLFFALRQLWLQSLATTEVPACLPGFEVLLHYFPWRDVLVALFWGAGECAEVSWHLLGFSLAVWTASYFLVMLFASALLIWKSQSLKRNHAPKA